MRISISFYSLKDLSDISNGEKLLEILSYYALVIEKIGEIEPIKNDFTQDCFQQIWKGRGGVSSSFNSSEFLFKGKKEIQFLGMASWKMNIHPRSRSFNGVPRKSILDNENNTK